MQSSSSAASSMGKKQPTDSKCHLPSTLQEPVDISSLSGHNDCSGTEHMTCQCTENTCRELVLYDPVNKNGAVEIEPFPRPLHFQPPVLARHQTSRRRRSFPPVGTFTVQCANCFKWRIIPTKEKYEELREHILEQPFYCEIAREWRPDISCDDPTDLSQDGSRIWAIDKPNIAQPPSGWQRLLRIRGDRSSKFADVYYVAPSGKRLRSMIEIQNYLMEHPEYLEDVGTMSRFSFQIPKPLQERYVRKRQARKRTSFQSTRVLQPNEVSAVTWTDPGNGAGPQLGCSLLSPPPDLTIL
ncbi:hypothetical protein K2173_020775 [Erythroxylum novogranatense]|uniref:Uncharacterized protein n=1 Tax=Erythroxylum novogranatense TaxID=1862640 RepID=A0AAV8TPD9_9ROSI|nr:hypothetical protein K2173_020775 [Erythroxylum novogranatense]